MKRLIIIGNGFDLAHKRKTKFSDFILDYFCDVVNEFYFKMRYKDELIEINIKRGYGGFSSPPKQITPEDVLEKLKLFSQHRDIELKFHSMLLERVFQKIVKLNWVDIEIEFFNVLIKVKNASDRDLQLSAISKVNSHLDILKNMLKDYLKKENFKKDEIINCFTENILGKEIVMVQTGDATPKDLYFLNFNYTSTLDNYLEVCNKIIPSTVNHIHGDLNEKYAKPIFGFGDELDKRFIEFEDENNNELFKHIKSFEYLQTVNYYNLIRFVDSEPFQVQIFGHSCGLSDRTMLNQIFEHDNCLSVKIFYHQRDDGTNDFTDKTYEISRHFKNKGVLRKKLVPFQLSRRFPELNVEN